MIMLTADQVAAVSSVKIKTLQRWSTSWEQTGTGDGPRPRRLSARITRYRLDDVAQWLGVDSRDIKVPDVANRTLIHESR